MKFAWSKPYFKDREEAARLLAGRLSPYQGENPLVLAVPRGAVPMGRILADELKGELGLALAHKIGAPDNPELALGAVGEDGSVYLAPYARSLGYSEEGLEPEIKRQLLELKKKRVAYFAERPPMEVEGRVVILLDDGIATGSTLMAAIQDLRRRGPRRIVVASAVAPPEVVERLRREADEVEILALERDFGAVGEFFEDFRQVTDQEVLEALRGS